MWRRENTSVAIELWDKTSRNVDTNRVDKLLCDLNETQKTVQHCVTRKTTGEWKQLCRRNIFIQANFNWIWGQLNTLLLLITLFFISSLRLKHNSRLQQFLCGSKNLQTTLFVPFSPPRFYLTRHIAKHVICSPEPPGRLNPILLHCFVCLP